MQKGKICVFDLGGSAMAPDGPDEDFLLNFRHLLRNWLEVNPSYRLIIVVGGGSAARRWQNAARSLSSDAHNESLDRIGMQATRLNAELLCSVLGNLCPDPVVINPEADFPFTGSILVCAGWKPGFSTDYISVLMAKQSGCNSVIVISNISHVYSEDPRINPQAQVLENPGWEDYIRIIDSEWQPGINLPFDPVASRSALKAGIAVKLVSAKDFANIRQLLDGLDFVGTTIGGPQTEKNCRPG